jgi:hypothetical protein
MVQEHLVEDVGNTGRDIAVDYILIIIASNVDTKLQLNSGENALHFTVSHRFPWTSHGLHKDST